jgi:hypothetical protein
MNKKLPRVAGCESVKWDPATDQPTFEIPPSGDYDADNAAAVKVAKTCVGNIEKLLGEPHSSSGLTNKQASLLARQKRSLESFIEQYERRS